MMTLVGHNLVDDMFLVHINALFLPMEWGENINVTYQSFSYRFYVF